MITSVELEKPLSYMIIWIILAVLAIAFLIFLQIFFRKKFGDRLKRPKKIKVKKPKPKTLMEIKLNYIGQLDQLTNRLNARQVTIREAYQEMSKIIRGFAFEATGIPVDKYSLAEIRKVGIPALTQLVAEYYEPEFARFTYVNVNQSIHKTRKVLELWH